MADANTVRVLLVEDDEEDYLIDREFLSRPEGFRIEMQWARSLAAAVEALASAPDVVLLDLTLPDSAGWDTFLRFKPAAGDIPIILLTGLSDEGLGVRAVREGAQDYLVKQGLDGRLLQRAIRYAIERRKTERRLRQIAEELRVRNCQFADDLRMAREIQLAMIPRRYPVFPLGIAPEESLVRFFHVYLPSQEVGGDYFQIMPLSDVTAAVFICDVMGHGMRAALVTAVLRGLLEEMRDKAGDPGHLLTAMNWAMSKVFRSARQPIFATAACLTVDTRGTMRYASAGHPRPLLLRDGGRRCEWYEAAAAVTGPMLGLFRQEVYATGENRLAPGDVAVLYTDGLTEARGADGVEYGEERLGLLARRAAGLPLAERAGEIEKELTGFSGGRFEDDVCLVGIEMGAGAPGG